MLDLFYSGVPASHNSLTVDHHAEHQDPETEIAEIKIRLGKMVLVCNMWFGRHLGVYLKIKLFQFNSVYLLICTLSADKNMVIGSLLPDTYCLGI